MVIPMVLPLCGGGDMFKVNIRMIQENEALIRALPKLLPSRDEEPVNVTRSGGCIVVETSDLGIVERLIYASASKPPKKTRERKHRWDILVALYNVGIPLSAVEIAEETQLSRSRVYDALTGYCATSLVNRGLVRKIGNGASPRPYRFMLTSKGENYVARLLETLKRPIGREEPLSEYCDDYNVQPVIKITACRS